METLIMLGQIILWGIVASMAIYAVIILSSIGVILYSLWRSKK